MATAIVCAYSLVGTEAMKGLLDAGVEILALYTYPQPSSDAWFVPPAQLAEEKGIPVYVEPSFNSDPVYDRIHSLRPDFLFSFYFRDMIQARFLSLPRMGAYNLHGSLLPAYRGRAPLNWVLVKGEQQTGITLHAMTPKPDDGDIIAQQPLKIAWDETALSLTHRAADAARPLVSTAVTRLLEGQANRVPQSSLGKSTYFGGRTPADSRLDFSTTVADAFNQIRAVADPWPNAFIETERGMVHIAWALPANSPCPMGHFRQTSEGVLLGFSDGALRLHALRREQRSERPTEHARWLRDAGVPEAH